MHIKTITCHEVYNYGATLQEYALLKYLQNLGHDAEAIHYKPKYLADRYNLWENVNPKFNFPILKQIYLLAKLPVRLRKLKRKKNFDCFSQKYIPTGSVLYHNNEDLKRNPPIAAAYICGSDQIWNTLVPNGNDPAFYLDFVPNDKLKISYAPSFATEYISVELSPFIKKMISKLDKISVRETSALQILESLEIDNGVQVMDPVFLLDAKFWKEQFVEPIAEPYIFIYDFETNPAIKEKAIRLAKEKNWKIYTVSKNIKYADKNYWDRGPAFFLSLIANSKMVFTNSFHALAFSIIFEKEFYVVNRNENINTRLRDLLNLVGLSDRTVNHFDNNRINFQMVKEILKERVHASKAYLDSALSSKSDFDKV